MTQHENLNAFLVGGYVRDKLLGLKPHDRDWVVVGSTPEEMLSRGFEKVGAAFPVFLHPETREHYALARRERKVAPGHKGFVVEFGPEVTLEEDLGRRDLTVNAIAELPDGALFDPFGGRWDIDIRLLRATSPASFADDPLRVLRLARFAARFPEFGIASETLDLARSAVAELSSLTPERVYGETCLALLTRKPSRFFETLDRCDALEAVFPEVAKLKGAAQHPDYHPEGTAFDHTMLVLDEAAKNQVSPDDKRLAVAFAALYHDIGKGATPPEELPHHYAHEKTGAEIAGQALARLRAPLALTRFVGAAVRHHMRAHRWRELREATILEILEALGALDEPYELTKFLRVADADARGRGLPVAETELVAREDFFYRALGAARRIRGADLIAAGVPPGPLPGQVGPRLREARIKAIKRIPR